MITDKQLRTGITSAMVLLDKKLIETRSSIESQRILTNAWEHLNKVWYDLDYPKSQALYAQEVKHEESIFPRSHYK